MRQLISLVLAVGGLFNVSAQQTVAQSPVPVTAKVSVRHVAYCRADADVFTVSLRLNIEVANTSTSVVQLLWPMVPWVGKIGSSLEKAKSGRFLFEQTASHYPQQPTHFDRLKIEPGEKVHVQSGYDLVARYNPTFSLANSVTAGRYGMILVLRPEEEPPSELQGQGIVQSLTTDPFWVRIPKHPKVAVCGADGKTR
jgi:hypothetical protein